MDTEKQARLEREFEAEHVRLVADMRVTVVGSVMGKPVTWGEFSDAFDRVKDPENWKLPIDRTIPVANDRDMETIRAAVEFFTASRPTFEAVGRGRYRVRAIGYYRAVGA